MNNQHTFNISPYPIREWLAPSHDCGVQQFWADQRVRQRGVPPIVGTVRTPENKFNEVANEPICCHKGFYIYPEIDDTQCAYYYATIDGGRVGSPDMQHVLYHIDLYIEDRHQDRHKNNHAGKKYVRD